MITSDGQHSWSKGYSYFGLLLKNTKEVDKIYVNSMLAINDSL